MTAPALIFYSVGAVGLAAGYLLTRGFYSLQDTRTPLKISIVMVLFNLGFSLLLIGPLRHAGLALANSLANLIYMALMMWYLGKKIPGLYHGGLFKFTMSVLTAAGLMAMVCYLVNGTLAGLVQGKTGLVIQIGLSGVAGVVVFVAAVFAMRVEEAYTLWHTLKKALAGRAKL
jgi:putative peptidoglycan lipid II flippase